MKVPVIINNRNLVTWPKAMVEKIQQLEDVGEIWIIDNASTYGSLLEWLDTRPCRVVRLSENLGHTAPWDFGIIKTLITDYYVVTDGDLDLSDVSNDVLRVMRQKLISNPSLGKVGLGLDWRKVDNTSPYFNHMMNYEAPRWKNSEVVDGVYTGVPVDTTFAMYNKPSYFIGGGSLSYPYVARHLPWEITDINENEEFKFYIENANSSSSYKTFLGL